MMAVGLTAWAQAPAAPGAANQVDKASAYYHYTLAHMYAELASAYGNRNDYLNKAIENYKEAIKADPTTPLLAEELSELYIGSGRLREAQSDAEDALRKNPNDIAAHRLLAHIFTQQIGDRQQNRVDQGMLQKAIEEYQKLTALAPDDVDSWLMLGRLQKVAQNSVESENAFKKALAIDPENEDALTGLAQVYLDLGDNTSASALIKKLADKSPSQRSLRALANAYEQMKEYALAADALNRAVEMNPPDASDLKHELAQDQVFAKQYDAALKTYQELVEDEPSDAQALLRMSQIYREQRDFAKAREMSDKAKAIEPDNIEIRYNEVGILEAEGKVSDAITSLNDLLISTQKRAYNQEEKSTRLALLEKLANLYTTLDQTQPAVDTLRQMADLDSSLAPRLTARIISTYEAGKDFPKAEQEAEAAVKKWPDDRTIHLTHARLLADMGKVDPAAAEVKKLLGGKDDRETYLALAEVYDKGKKFDEMVKSLDAAEKLSQTNDEKKDVWFMRGAMYEKQKKEEQSEAEFRKILELDPDNAATLNYLGFMLADRNMKLNEALEMITKAVNQEPNNGAYLDSLGWVYFRLGRLPEAEDNIRKALVFTPRDATVRDHLGDVLMKESKVRDAVAQWEVSLKEWSATSPADQEPADIAKVKSKLDTAKVRLAKENASKPEKR
ncbi:MAG TPA: tetratricopeptide repeat protein [Bryobacteraceae bacterium]|nr:tetratricopeptide repeat protein [Bryobacteraceae bacterium]